MLPASEEEKASVIQYYLSQSPGTEVSFLQKVYSEAIIGHRHDVWDVHATDGRWWVITNPTNLYSQAQFPNMDLAVTFHMGLCLRVPRTQRQRRSDRNIRPFGVVFAKLHEASDALGQAQNVADYQAIGMRGREALLAFVGAAQDIAAWTTEATAKRADFRAWSELICDVALAGSSQKERRHLFKSLLTDAWVFANWLTHAQSATWHDAEAAQTTIEHVLGLVASLVLRHIRSVPEQCPNCNSPHLLPEEGWREDLPEVAWERPVCGDCGWTGRPVVVGELSDESKGDDLFTRVGGGDDDACIIPKVPLTKLSKPGDG
ncbi:hypothetical protein [Methylocapsa acidiphila]|uniref:hypothetical protein n=1 Tax=Methylocapsa acidiphila TaxID=133552 RepID=UPI0012EB6F8A|nr:hypothetical protein [Methylocapsa acidiphila]